MPKRTDINSVLILGAGPIVIGQACEFDYSGVQACKALREEGYRVILVNSNPATIMTDPDTADAVYIEPVTPEFVTRVIEREQPDALLPTMGGQTALNCALDLVRDGTLNRFGIELIGASEQAINMAEDRALFRQAMQDIDLHVARSEVAHNLEEAHTIQKKLGFPTIIRPSFTLGGSGGGIAYNTEEFVTICQQGFELSPTSELLIEQSVLGWKEFEMEVVRDQADNCIIVCSIENLDPMGIHTGDSITVAPAQTLTDKEYQLLRDASLAVLRKIGVDTGGSNVQFAINPDDGEILVIEMNPRVSRSSALASKATGFPIAKIAAKLAVGYTLDELKNDITGGATPAAFEPSIDYVVTKVPRFAFEKFPQAKAVLGTQMQSVGEVMAMGRTFAESLQKALRGLETGLDGLSPITERSAELSDEALLSRLQRLDPERILWLGDAFRRGLSRQEVHQATAIDPWFLAQIERICLAEQQLSQLSIASMDSTSLRQAKRLGFSDMALARICHSEETTVRARRHALAIRPTYKRVDSCAAEFPTHTAYLYSTYEEECEAQPDERDSIMVLGGGPNRIGQGIEFDYCCVQAVQALRQAGYQTIMVNCNPETVSTDYDTSDRLYFEPLTLEDVLEVVAIEQPKGVIVHYGGQTPLKLARDLEAAGVPIIGTSPDAIDLAEDRERFQQLVHKLGLKQPPNRTARNETEAMAYADEIGYPLVVRPSYVLGGRAMEIVYNRSGLTRYMREAMQVSNDCPVLLDHFLNQATEIDVDALCDGERVIIGGIMEHIEQAGVHSGDSACCLPPFSLSAEVQQEICRQMSQLALAIGVVGLMNAQFALQGDDIYLLEVNPRASRTVPFVSKACGISLAAIGARLMAGARLSDLGLDSCPTPPFYAVKEAVFPFIKFRGVDPLLGPEMRSTGEVMGIGRTMSEAFERAQKATQAHIPEQGCVLFSVRDRDKPAIMDMARALLDQGYQLTATAGTAHAMNEAGIACDRISKVGEARPDIIDRIKNGEIQMIINTTSGERTVRDSTTIRREAVQHNLYYTTTLAAAEASVQAMVQPKYTQVQCLQELHAKL